jgi:hypothetical protein
MRTITMSPNGRRTLPAEVRRRLGSTGRLTGIREGRVRRLSDDDLAAYDD